MGLGCARVLLTGQHPRQFAHALGPVEEHDVARGEARTAVRPGIGVLDHANVAVGIRRHLGQVRHDDHLYVAGQHRQPSADFDGGAGFTASDVVLLDGAERVRELARMLAGQEDSNTAQAHAEELLDDAQQAVAALR